MVDKAAFMKDFEINISLCTVNTRHLRSQLSQKSRRKRRHETSISLHHQVWLLDYSECLLQICTQRGKNFLKSNIFFYNYVDIRTSRFIISASDQKPKTKSQNTCCCCRNLKREEARLSLLFLNCDNNNKKLISFWSFGFQFWFSNCCKETKESNSKNYFVQAHATFFTKDLGYVMDFQAFCLKASSTFLIRSQCPLS